MNVGDFVIVINEEKNLYRRRCKIINIDECSNGTRYLVMKELIESERIATAKELIKLGVVTFDKLKNSSVYTVEELNAIQTQV